MKRSFACFSFLYVLTIAACAGDKQSGTDSTGAKAGAASATTASSGDLTGAGSTFANPLYSRWSSDYAAKTNVHVNYQPIGSGGGIRQFSEMTVDFGGTDSPMTDAQLSAAKGGPVLHVPTALGAAVITYNLAGVAQPLKVTGGVIGDIFLGKITKWNDGRIAALDPGVT
ncbi:MAG TPA: phosphate ABC transporter substrate-binding protein PstS, partial [Gemmatimonadaceae bacterium]